MTRVAVLDGSRVSNAQLWS